MTRTALALAAAALIALACAVPAGAKTTSFTSQSITNGDPTQSGRLSQNGVASTCAAPKATPPSAEAGTPFHYDEFAVTNDGPGTSCVHVNVTGGSCGTQSAVHAVAYQPTFNPASIQTNYKGDTGGSTDASDPSNTYSFGAAPGAMAVTAHGMGTSGLCASYAMTARVAASASTNTAINVGQTGATLRGVVNEESEESTIHFEYGTTTSYGQESTSGGFIGSADNANHNASRNVTGLDPDTVYHFRAVVEYGANGSFPAGTAVGQDQTFRTTADPTAVTRAATNVAAESATLNGTVNPGGAATNYKFQYGTTASYGTTTTPASAGSDHTDHPVSTAIPGLEPNTTYHYRVVAEQGNTVVNGQDVTFTTPPLPPAATTDAATEVTADGARLNGRIDPGGAATTFTFQYGKTASYGTTTTQQAAGSDHSVHAVSDVIPELEPGTTYHYRIVAQQGSTVANGDDVTFTTPPLPPTASTGTATSVSLDAATLNGSVDPGGAETTFTFEFGETTSYGSATAAQSAGSDHTVHSVSAPAAGLKPNTTYHYRIVAQQGSTMVTGNDATFTTAGGGGTSGVGAGAGTTAGQQLEPPDVVVPAFSQGPKASPAKFKAAKSGASVLASAATGTRVSYSLSEPASVAFTVERAAAGRKVKGTCKAPNARNRKAKPCVRFVKVKGGFTHAGAAGANSLRFTGRVGGKALTPGRYRLVAVAIDAAGNRSQTKQVNFKIVR